jgi:hypothetical protein
MGAVNGCGGRVIVNHPVQLQVAYPIQTERIHVVTRLLFLLAFATLGWSAVYWALYLALPAAVAVVLTQKGSERYLSDDAPRIVRVLRWLASAYGYLWLLTDVLPTAQGSPVDLQIEAGGRPTASSALLRLLFSVPALVVLAVLSAASGILWVVGAVLILIRKRLPATIADILALTLRFQFQLIAYHLSLVDRYPSLRAERVAHAAI